MDTKRGKPMSARYEVLYPQEYTITAERILELAKDAEANGEIPGSFGDDPNEAIRQMSDAGLMTFKRRKRVCEGELQ